MDGGSVVAALGPRPLPALGVDGLSSADLAEQLVRAALVQQREQLLPGGELEWVDESAGAVAEQRGAMQAPAGERVVPGRPSRTNGCAVRSCVWRVPDIRP